MKLINRGQIVVFPKTAFQEWAASNSEEDLFFSSKPEPSVYLIEEDFWEDDKIIEKYRSHIIRRECSEICLDPSKWLTVKSNEEFEGFFEIHLGIVVVDLLSNEIQAESIDL